MKQNTRSIGVAEPLSLFFHDLNAVWRGGTSLRRPLFTFILNGRGHSTSYFDLAQYRS